MSVGRTICRLLVQCYRGGCTSSSGAIELVEGCHGRTTPASRMCRLDTMRIRIHQEEWKEVRGPAVGSRWVVGFVGIGSFRDRLTSLTSGGGDRIWRRWFYRLGLASGLDVEVERLNPNF